MRAPLPDRAVLTTMHIPDPTYPIMLAMPPANPLHEGPAVPCIPGPSAQPRATPKTIGKHCRKLMEKSRRTQSRSETPAFVPWKAAT